MSGYDRGFADAIEAAAKCMEAYANGNHVDRLRAARIRSLKRPSVSGGGEIKTGADYLSEQETSPYRSNKPPVGE